LVKTNTVFWNASGINANFSLFSGASIDIESLRALLDGGIAFATPDQGGQAVKPGAVFTLHDRPQKEWRAWAPHIRLHEDTAPQAKTGTGAVSKPPAPGDTTGPAAAKQGGAKDGGDAATPALSDPPTSVTLLGRVTPAVLTSKLEDLGYANISAVEKSGSIYHLRADWQGRPLKLRIDSRDGEIKVMGR
jgi:hypothetical protein